MTLLIREVIEIYDLEYNTLRKEKKKKKINNKKEIPGSMFLNIVSKNIHTYIHMYTLFIIN